MAPRRAVLLTLAVLACAALACSFTAAAQPTATPTLDYASTQAVETELAATHAADQKATEIVQQTRDAQATTVAMATEAYLAGQSTAEALKTMNANRKETRKAATVEAQLARTETARPFAERVQKLADDRLITSAEGTYHTLDDFDQTWAQINWYQWWRTGLELENFVIRADAEWDSASHIANWFSSGCGFVFAESGEDNHYASFLALDGHVYNYRNRSGVYTELKSGYYGPVETPNGHAEIMMVVENHTATFFVNDVRVVRFEDQSLGSGGLGLTLNSGTNKDYGTRCRMTNIEVWELK